MFLALMVATPWSSAFAAEDNEEPTAAKTAHEATQAEDADTARDKSLLSKKPADEAVARKAAEGDQAFYEKWQFWAIAGGAVAGLVLAYFGGKALYHTANGGDVRPCNTTFFGCFGQGEPQ